MQTGAPTFGTPEPAIVLYTVAALARRLGVPFRSGGSMTASKLPDAQAAYESASTLLPTVMAGVNFVLHAGLEPEVLSDGWRLLPADGEVTADFFGINATTETVAENVPLEGWRLRRAQDRLSEAIENGATDEEIAELMQELRDATQDYLRQRSQQVFVQGPLRQPVFPPPRVVPIEPAALPRPGPVRMPRERA